jgi:DNA-binding NtrC family response regulator
MPKQHALRDGRPCLVVGCSDAVVPTALKAGGFDPKVVAGVAEGLVELDRRPWVLILAGQGIGPDALRSLIARWREGAARLVVLGTTAKLQEAVDAMQLGAADFIPPPFSADAMIPRLEKLLARTPPEAQMSRTSRTSGLSPSFAQLGFAGSSPALERVFASISRIARYKTNVLVLGESGTGKELIARALHVMGQRRNHPFVPLNCATLGREILENELFGHERGAFTGANERKKGLFELADGGTLFLDEIAEMDPSTQAKLLRVLERNEFRRVGGMNKVKVDLSLVAATNRSLEAAIAAGKFREDLYYRLKVVTVVMPPLRERREDIPALIDSFIADFNRRNGGKIRGIAPPALRRLMEHDWPGNVRELKNAVESAAVMTDDDTIELGDFEGVSFGAPSLDEIVVSPGATLAEVERLMLLDRLARARTKADAARSLGIGLRTLYTKIRTLQLDTSDAARLREAKPRAETA